MQYETKKKITWAMIIIPFLYLLVYSAINFFTYYGLTMKIGAFIAFALTIIWIIGDNKLKKL